MELGRSILWTAAYFDIFDYPLTNFEIWKYLWNPHSPPPYEGGGLRRGTVSLQEMESELRNLSAVSKVETKDGFYFLPGRANIVWQRKLNFQISKRKIDRAKILAKIFASLPYLRGVFLCNKVAQGIASKDSDIDFFIITEKNRIWTVRFFTTLILKILGLRPREPRKGDTFCLSFYASSGNLSLENFMLPPCSPPSITNLSVPSITNLSVPSITNLSVPSITNLSVIPAPDLSFPRKRESSRGQAAAGIHPEIPHQVRDDTVVPDIHYIYWLAAFLPLYDDNRSVREFVASNSWIKKYLPNLELTSASSILFSSRPMLKRATEKFLDFFGLGDLAEKVLQQIQLRLMPKELKQAAQALNTDVIISGAVLKFHSNDRRQEYREQFRERLRLLNLF